MFKSFFNKKDNSINTTDSSFNNLGLDKEHPILMNSIDSSYKYLDCLCSIKEGLSYERIGTTVGEGYQELIDKYVFNIKGETLCCLFVYAYHTESVPLIPTPFKTLNSNANESVFESMLVPLDEKNSNGRVGRLDLLQVIVDFILMKNNLYSDEDVLWTSEKQDTLNNFLEELGYDDSLEKLILDEFKLVSNQISSLNKGELIKIFISKFHHKKLSKYTPHFIQERNEKIKSAYNSIIEMINRIQAWQDNDLVRRRIEIDTSNSQNNISVSNIKQCIVPFCTISLGCDSHGSYNILYGIETRISDIIPDDFANTLIRRIYEFTPGELEGSVFFVSLHMDCITLFEESLQKADDENYQLIEVKRKEEKSIDDMLSKLELKDDIDEKTNESLREQVDVKTKNKWLYPTDEFGKMEEGVVDDSKTTSRDVTKNEVQPEIINIDSLSKPRGKDDVI